MTKTCLISLLILFFLPCYILEGAISIDVLALVESDFNKNAISCKGAKSGRGVCQISEIMLEDYNKCNDRDIKPYQLFNIQTNMMICSWAVYERIPKLLLDSGRAVSDREVLIVYNIGIGNYNAPYKYIKRYEEKKYKLL